MFPAIDPADYLTKEIDNGKEIGELSSNIVNKSVMNNSKCFAIPPINTLTLFFVKTLIEWNVLEDTSVDATSVESFKSALMERQ